MTWNPREYLQRVEAMFEGVTGDVERIGKEFIAIAGERLVLNTPGPGLQYALTEYIATGRLRAGWSFGSNPPDSVSQFEGGPYDDRGIRTSARIRAEIFSIPLQPESFIWNDVAYAVDVHYGRGAHEHIGARPWVYDISLEGNDMLAEAVERVGARA